MTTKSTTIALSATVGGMIFASLMAAADYSSGMIFRPGRFAINFVLFGVAMGFITQFYFFKKQNESE